MPRVKPLFSAALLGAVLGLSAAGPAAGETAALYAQHCASCHGPERLGGAGPAVVPENMGRLTEADAAAVIANGRPATEMPAFSDRLSPDDIQALARFVFVPPAAPPLWGEAEMRATHSVNAESISLPDKPAFAADPLNLFVVVERGDHHVSILDGDKFEVLERFQSRAALHGGPKFSADGRYVYFMSRDGWVMKYDLWNLVVVAEIRAGINARNIALSPDGRLVMVGNYLPHTLVALDAGDLSPVAIIEATDKSGKISSRVSAVYQSPRRKSVIVALKDVPEMWEVFTGPDAPKVYAGFVHNYEAGMVEAVPVDSAPFPIRRIELSQPLDDFFFDPEYRHAIGSARDGDHAVVVNLDVGREIATLPLPGLPHLGSGIAWIYEGHPVVATPHLKDAAISIIDMKTWKVIRRIETLGPGFFLRSHENSDYAIADVSLGPRKDMIEVIDKRTLEVVRTLRPDPGKTAAHAEFTRDGRFVLISVSEMDGAVVVYDATTFAEVKRIPMSEPLGKYNVYNKIHFSDGTSH